MIEIKIKEKPTGESEKESEKIEDDFNPEKVEADDKSDNSSGTPGAPPCFAIQN